MSGNNLESNIEGLNGQIMRFDKNKTKFKIYNSVEKSNDDKDFTNPINIFEFNLDLLKELIACAEPNVRYNCSRIIEAKISNGDFTESQTKDLLSIVKGQLEVEKNLRVKAAISNILSKNLAISKEIIIELLANAFDCEENEFWKFELLTILLMNTGNTGLGKEALAKYKKTNVFS